MEVEEVQGATQQEAVVVLVLSCRWVTLEALRALELELVVGDDLSSYVSSRSVLR